MAESYAPRASRTGGSNYTPKGKSPAKGNGEKSLVSIGGGWKKDWGYSCVLTVGGRKYKVLAFWNKYKDGNNPPELSFNLRTEEQDGEPAQERG
tara:strand:+ start:1311 stop:1592 length:282 start_codon:yes stop_codon:yes gene_type:complete